MAKVVNLNRYRKKRARDDGEKTADSNRVKHGRTKEERQKERRNRERDASAHDARRLENLDDEDGPEPT